ncbi:hexokinase-domain-containing protein [Thamnidium elegans]|nr:hexokinase-domain-containing protein [Thamnidium elegans]
MIPTNLVADEKTKECELRSLEKQFDLNTEQLRKVSKLLQDEMKNGLAKCDRSCNVPMLPTWIVSHPTGQEVGEYIGLDLSGSNLRVYLVTLHGHGRITTRQLKYSVKDNIKKGHINNLINFMAECVDSFLTFVNKADYRNPLHLGVCISFPLRQTAMNNAYVERWTKDFEITGARNKNLVELLQTALHSREIPVIVKAAVNGAAGCLLAHSYRSLDTLLSCTVSTGTNAAYWEKISKVGKLKDRFPSQNDGEMIVTTEWGGFGDTRSENVPHTFYDIRVNRQSVNPGVHVFEKMVAGLYLGEIVRLILVDFTDRRLLFDAQYSTEMNKPYSFESAYMSAIESDDTSELEGTKHLLEHVMNLKSTTLQDRKTVKRICEMVGKRAARLIAAAMSAIISKRDALEQGLSISVEGTVYEFYPNFPARVNTALQELYGENFERINIGITRDGSGVGAALAAMLASNNPKA